MFFRETYRLFSVLLFIVILDRELKRVILGLGFNSLQTTLLIVILSRFAEDCDMDFGLLPSLWSVGYIRRFSCPMCFL